jgi:hypothetical protein
LTEEEAARNNIIVSIRQAAEWGMRALQASFRRLNVPLPSNKHKRKLIVLSSIYLHNFRVALMGINQINMVFNPHYTECMLHANYDRIANYYVHAFAP